MSEQKCQCGCGHTEFTVVGEPLFRVLCHCSICQKFNDAPNSDILVYKSKQVKGPSEGVVSFETYMPPPNVQRGKCLTCHQAAIEIFNMPLMPTLTMVPAGMLSNSVKLPEPKAHMFYEKRVKDADDDLPKKSGFMSSQMAFFRYLWFKR